MGHGPLHVQMQSHVRACLSLASTKAGSAQAFSMALSQGTPHVAAMWLVSRCRQRSEQYRAMLQRWQKYWTSVSSLKQK